MATTVQRLTYAQYMAEEEDNRRYDIIDGVRDLGGHPRGVDKHGAKRLPQEFAHLIPAQEKSLRAFGDAGDLTRLLQPGEPRRLLRTIRQG